MQEHVQTMHRSAVGHLTQRHPMMELALLYHRLDNSTESGGPLSFRQMPFLVEPYTEMPDLEHLVVRKCTQVGWTTLMVVFAVMQAQRGRKHAVVLPDEKMMRGFIQDELNPLIDRVPFYGALQKSAARRDKKGADNMQIKHLGRGTWRFLGSKVAAPFRSFRTDSILVDEVDNCLQSWLGMVHDRVEASQHPQKFWLGNPSLSPERGISRMFHNTDQRHWFQRCTRCGHRQHLDWFTHFVEKDDHGGWRPRDHERAEGLSESDLRPGPARDIRPVCVRCHRPWDRTADGCCWVAKHPGRGRRGYTVAQMDHLGRCLWSRLLRWNEIQGNTEELVVFYGSVFGYPYEPPGGRLTEGDLAAAIGPWPMDYLGGEQYRDQTVTAGVDVGAVFHIKVSVEEERSTDPSDPDADTQTIRRVVWMGTVGSWAAVEDCYERYHVNASVVDSEPATVGAKEHRDRINHGPTATRVWLWRHREQAKVSRGTYGLETNELTGEVTGDKHHLLDATTQDVRRGRREFPADSLQVLTWVDHMRAPVRLLVASSRGERYRWSRGSKRDDYRMADAHDRVAADVLAMGSTWSELTIR